MKHLLITTIAAVVLVGCGKSDDIWTAAEEGNVEAVKGYLANGVNVDERDESYGGTPLHFAAYRGNEVVELLIANGADVNAKNQADATPLDKAIEKNRDETVNLLRKHGGKTKKELEAAGKSIKPIAEAAKPKPPTAKASDTSIHVATEAGNIESVKQAIADGADVTAKASDTSIHVATEAGNIESVKQAIADGADVNEKNADGVAPLSNAAYFGHKEVVELLITNGADVNAKFDGRTPLDFATHPDNPNKNKAELADLLRKHGGKTGEELKAEGK